VRGRPVSPLTSRVLPDRCRILPSKITAQGAVQWPGSSIGQQPTGAQHGRSAEVIRWQADPDHEATRPEDRKRRGRATHYEGVLRCRSRAGRPRWLHVRRLLLVAIVGCWWWFADISGTRASNAWARFSAERRRRTTSGTTARTPGSARTLQVWLCTHAREVRLPEANTYARNMPPGANGVRDLLSATAPSWTFRISVVCVIQDHPAHTP
jgi:hypothetical protein